MRGRRLCTFITAAVSILTMTECRTARKVAAIRGEEMNVVLSLPEDRRVKMLEIDTSRQESPDTVVVNFEGRRMLVMKAVLDDSTGEMVASEELTAAVVTARFRNIAERHGRIDIEFEIRVPEKIRDTDWQLRFRPEMWILEDTLALDRVLVTGTSYRRAQMRGYQLYSRFMSRIVSDTSCFLNIRGFEVWLKRNIPEVYNLRKDSSFVSEDDFASIFRVTEREAREHFTMEGRIHSNERRLSRQKLMYDRYVKVPMDAEGVRVDTVLSDGTGDFVYRYVETVATRPSLRKVDVVVDGEIYRQDELLYDMPPTEPLTFYISSLTAFVDSAPRYRTEVVYRRAEASAVWNIDFLAGRSDVDAGLGENARRISNIREILGSLLEDSTYDLDSVTITAFASPEGAAGMNGTLCRRRGKAVADYFSRCLVELSDSMRAAEGVLIDLADIQDTKKGNVRDVPFTVRSGGENWSALDVMVEADTTLSMEEKEDYSRVRSSIVNPDECEGVLRQRPYYRHLRENLYPALRNVEFFFALHRKGMIRDTVFSTALDEDYMDGVQAIRDRDYLKALSLLGPYRDLNTAVALLSLDRNSSAMEILERLEPSPRVKYMMALIHSRRGEESEAVRLYCEACLEEPSFVHRGNLDPEISTLIRRYNLTFNN